VEGDTNVVGSTQAAEAMGKDTSIQLTAGLIYLTVSNDT
jgi:hypothetical protein